MKSKAYIIANDEVVAQVFTSLRSGASVRWACAKVSEKIDAAREWNLVNAEVGKISRAKKWESIYARTPDECIGVEVNFREFHVF